MLVCVITCAHVYIYTVTVHLSGTICMMPIDYANYILLGVLVYVCLRYLVYSLTLDTRSKPWFRAIRKGTDQQEKPQRD